jgi:hypothetical protein
MSGLTVAEMGSGPVQSKGGIARRVWMQRGFRTMGDSHSQAGKGATVVAWDRHSIS